MAALSMDLRERILASYDRGEGTRDQIASRYQVSLGMVKKLLQQRRHRGGDISPQHHRSGRKPVILDFHRREMRALLAKQPDLTLEEIRSRIGLNCTIQAIHYVLVGMGLTYKKRRSAPRNNPGPMSPAPAAPGARSKKASSPPASSSSTSRQPRRT